MTGSFTEKDHLFFEYLDYFSTKLEATVLDNIIKIPTHIGKGIIKWYLLEEGFGLRFYDFIPKQDLEYNLFTEEESGTVYKLIFQLEKEQSYLTDNLSNKSAYLYFSDFQKNIKVKRSEHVCRLVLVFNTKWLEKNHSNANGKLRQLLDTLVKNNQSTFVLKELDRKSSYIVRQLVEMMNRSSFPPLTLKTNLFILLSTFLDKIISQSSKELPVRESLPYYSPHFKEITEVAEGLKKYINNPFSALPNIRDLAHEYHMSESTLRRHFKIVYGKNIYEYYQGKRMCWAKDEMEKGGVTISELALKLGFRKPNNFSKAFRKEFHIRPNELKHILTVIMYLYFTF
ncbi:MAG: AraC family transcriptional regulator [Ginsengibacter sp.]